MKKYYILSVFFIFISCKENMKKSKPFKQIKSEVQKTILNKKSILANVKKSVINKEFILGKYDYHKNNDFIKVKNIHSSKSIYLNKITYKAFIKMFNGAKSDNINLKIISGTRSFYEQKAIWERKWLKYKAYEPILRTKKILEFSSMPSTSRHHWGTDIDLNNLNNFYFEKGKGKKEYDWLVLNAKKYGFFQVYTKKENGRTGYNLEKWHWSYLPLASECLKFYNKNITYKDIKGFKGSEYSIEVEVIKNYVNGLSKKTIEYRK